MELSIVAPGKTVAGTVNVSDAAFAREYNEDLVHQVVTAYLAGGRQGTKAQKTRATVSGGGRKPWKQKGSGRARAGSNTSPVWVGGGRAFAAQPRNHSQKVNRKMYRAGMSAILSELARQNRLVVVDAFQLDQPKTKLLKERLSALGAPEALVVTDEIDTNLYLAGRNIPKVDVRDVQATDPVSLVSFDKVIVTVAALKKFEEMLG